jgi:hypothetical protein
VETVDNQNAQARKKPETMREPIDLCEKIKEQIKLFKEKEPE